jgi:hypothetical protein
LDQSWENKQTHNNIEATSCMMKLHVVAFTVKDIWMSFQTLLASIMEGIEENKFDFTLNVKTWNCVHKNYMVGAKILSTIVVSETEH